MTSRRQAGETDGMWNYNKLRLKQQRAKSAELDWATTQEVATPDWFDTQTFLWVTGETRKYTANSSQNNNAQSQLNLNKPPLKNQQRQTDLWSKHSHESVVHRKSEPTRKEKWKERYRARKTGNPLSVQEQKEKEHARYLRRKEAKKIKLTGNMTAREQRICAANGVKIHKILAIADGWHIILTCVWGKFSICNPY